MSEQSKIDELEKLLNSEEDTPIQILPNGEIRKIGAPRSEALAGDIDPMNVMPGVPKPSGPVTPADSGTIVRLDEKPVSVDVELPYPWGHGPPPEAA